MIKNEKLVNLENISGGSGKIAAFLGVVSCLGMAGYKFREKLGKAENFLLDQIDNVKDRFGNNVNKFAVNNILGEKKIY